MYESSIYPAYLRGSARGFLELDAWRLTLSYRKQVAVVVFLTDESNIH